MATAGIVIRSQWPDLTQLAADIKAIGDKPTNAAILKAALEKAIAPALARLEQITPVGPTGNLKRAASSLVKSYPKDGTAVALIGFKRSGAGKSSSAQGGRVEKGKDRAFHQWWIEYGTQVRKVPGGRSQTGGPKARTYRRKSPSVPFQRTRMGIMETVRGKGVEHTVEETTPTYIASSFNSLGPFRASRKTRGDSRVTTDPPYPNAFFKKSKEPITIRPVPAGGVAGRPPVRSAFEETQDQIANILQQELRASLEQVLNALTVRDSGSISGA